MQLSLGIVTKVLHMGLFDNKPEKKGGYLTANMNLMHDERRYPKMTIL